MLRWWGGGGGGGEGGRRRGKEEGAVRALTRASAAAISREQAITEVGKGVSGMAKREQLHAALMDAYHALAL